MRGKTGDIFTTIRTEGALLPAEILRRIVEADRELKGLDPESYHLEKSEKINEAVNRAWFRCLGAWRTFRAAAEKLPDSDAGTTLTRERWLLILFQELGYGRLLAAKAQEIGGNTYPISHIWHHTPIHLVSFRQDLDRRTPGMAGAARLSPHSLVQEFLNRSENHLWGIVSNGHHLRILRDNISMTRQAYVEFDLESIMEGEVYTDFVLLYLLLHQSRLEAEKQEECWLEKWSREAQERGTRALDRLRNGVEQAITALGQGFLAHPENTALRRALQEGSISPLGYYQQLLRLIYRFIFLFVAEDRGLIPLSDISPDDRKRYACYAIARLRRLAGRRRGTRHGDLYVGLLVTFACLEKGEAFLGIPALNGFLFSQTALPDLNGCRLSNEALLSAVRGLCYTEENRLLRPVDYRNLGTEELGSVYESLLELHPELNADAFTFSLKTYAGSERKTTGSYYTHPSLIRCLLDSALEPLLSEAMKKSDPEEALLSLKVVDPACGSGHFLIAAAHRIAKDLAIVRTGEGEPPLETLREALRDVVAHCIYGVDINPLAVELCKVALWLESLDPRKPLGFLDHRIKCGNSIIGATPELLKKGIPDDAFKAVEGDDSSVASSIRRKNKEERKGKQDLFMIQEDRPDWREAASDYTTWASLPEDNIEQVSEKARKYDTLIDGRAIRHQHDLADLWTAAFFWPLKKENYDTIPTQDAFRRLRDGAYSLPEKAAPQVAALAEEHRFFHWHLEFPEIFMKRQGFDCVLGNPPWERIKLQEKEFFAQLDPEIANAPNATARRGMISKLPETNPTLWKTYQAAKRKAEGESHFLRVSGRYPLCGRGDLNFYAVFAEQMQKLLNAIGRAGCVLPTGIATDDSNKTFIQQLVSSKSLVSFFDFTNRGYLFPGTESTLCFCLLTFSTSPQSKFRIAAQLWQVQNLAEDGRTYTLKQGDILRINPNTANLPTFLSAKDALLNKLIYRRVPILANELQAGSNPWNVSFLRMFDMTNDAGSFCTKRQLSDKQFVIRGSAFYGDSDLYLPLYEAKLAAMFNHRATTFEGLYESAIYGTRAATVKSTESELSNPEWAIVPRYWVSKREVVERTPKQWRFSWFIGFRNAISAVADARTVTFTIFPKWGAGNSLPLILPSETAELNCILVANLNSFVLDYTAKQKASGGNLNFYIVKQLPLLPPRIYLELNNWLSGKQTLQDWLLPRLLELTFTSWDLESFANNCGWNGAPFRWDEERRFKMHCELDAVFFHLYLPADHNGQWKPVCVTEGAMSEERPEELSELKRHFPTPRNAVVYVMDTFPVVERKDIACYGEYRTKRMILEIYDAMQRAKETGRPYQTILNPPPADARMCHPPRRNR